MLHDLSGLEMGHLLHIHMHTHDGVEKSEGRFTLALLCSSGLVLDTNAVPWNARLCVFTGHLKSRSCTHICVLCLLRFMWILSLAELLPPADP